MTAGEDDGVKQDAIDRFESVIERQINLLNDIDNKAQNLIQYTSVFLGLVFTAVSFVVRAEVFREAPPLVELLFLFGIASLLIAVGFAVYTYLSSVTIYGLARSYGERVADGDVTPEEYRTEVLNAYSYAVGENKEVIDANARRFRYSSAFLLIGLLNLSASGFLLLIPLPQIVRFLCVAFVVSTSIAVFYYIYDERYLVLERHK
jgi:uncharacterized membrane protein YoaK (UPF0700 family)